MRKQFLLLIIFLLMVAAAPTAFSEPAEPTAGPTVRVSVRSDGGEANNESFAPDISADGRFVAFDSAATNLVSDDNNARRDIFVHDRETGVTERVSVRSNGTQANGNSYAPAISDDGRIVVFHSFATNLVDGDSNNVADVFVHDRQTGVTSVASRVIGGSANDISYDADVSADGRYVVFWSYASNLVGGDNNGHADVFRLDLAGLVMERVSVDSNEAQANGESRWPSISGDGQRVAFTSDASNLVGGDNNGYADIFVRDLSAGTTQRVSVPDGTSNNANGQSSESEIADNGAVVAFASLASNLVSDDTNGYQDIFIHNLGNGNTKLVSIASNGVQANQPSEQPSISGDGVHVAFQTYADNLVSNDTNGDRDVFIRDRDRNVLSLVSKDSAGERANGSSKSPAVDGYGRYIAFSSKASDLIAGDTNGQRDIFVHDRKDPATLTIDYTTGAPGSHFIVSGANFAPNTEAQVSVNGAVTWPFTSNANGEIVFRLITTADTDEGAYFVTVTQGEDALTVGFRLASTAPNRPGSGGGFVVPDGIAYTQFVYLPVAARP